MSDTASSKVPIFGEIRDFVSSGAVDPLGAGITFSDFEPGDDWDDRPYPEEHLLQRFTHWLVCHWIESHLDEAETDEQARDALNRLAAEAGGPTIDEAADYDDELLFRFEFTISIADEVAEIISAELLQDNSLTAHFNERITDSVAGRRLRSSRSSRERAPQRPVDVPTWALEIVNEREAGRCGRCRRLLKGDGGVEFRIKPGDGGILDVANLEVVCQKCLG